MIEINANPYSQFVAYKSLMCQFMQEVICETIVLDTNTKHL